MGGMRHSLYDSEHDEFRAMVRAWAEKNVAPFHAQWEKDGIVPRDVWLSGGKQGLLGMDLEEQYGGGGVRDFRYNAVIDEEMVRIGASGVGFGLHNDVTGPYLRDLATDEQKQRWLPGFCSGELITAIAMTEPGAGSDLQGIQTTARKDGDGWVLNGSKTFITNGINSDLVIVVARTDPDAPAAKGTSLLVVERDMPGFSRGRNLEKVGLKAQDTAELFFDDVRVPAENLLGTENGGFIHLMENLPQERLSIAVGAVAACERMLAITHEYVTSRTAFGRPIAKFQNTRFVHGRAADRDRRSPAPSSTSASASSTPASSPSPTPPWPSGGRPSCRTRWPTAACSCTAASATWTSTRSRRPGGTRASRRSTAAPPRS